jgi:hypothetical protein
VISAIRNLFATGHLTFHAKFFDFPAISGDFSRAENIRAPAGILFVNEHPVAVR